VEKNEKAKKQTKKQTPSPKQVKVKEESASPGDKLPKQEESKNAVKEKENAAVDNKEIKTESNSENEKLTKVPGEIYKKILF
jgi:D-aminopeptidase